MGKFIVLLGPPGAGKGTQAERIAEELSIPHVSSGDLFRENLGNETELGKKAKGFMDSGKLVPDEITISMVAERLSRTDCKDGALLDGFPRTPFQAQELDAILKKNGNVICCVPYIMVSDQDLLERLTGRWTCKAAGHIYHQTFNPPKDSGICDIDGSALYQRDDDKKETIEKRLAVFHEQTAPLIEYYREKDLLVEVDGTQPIEKVTEAILKSVQSKK
ncbi:MAG TPA: adenylate kinase [Anaerolineaceae bacterium]|uniref:Adenylate kinase n=1 Tax=Anaerolinea thermophila TaxID=167964 RepID=A0A101FYU8_9CHLR|nr:MAG: Adenylate kinase [Anaerolinea thermophila]HAF62936.1 adenylate kinase [Anaerolineaceae bacterium]